MILEFCDSRLLCGATFSAALMTTGRGGVQSPKSPAGWWASPLDGWTTAAHRTHRRSAMFSALRHSTLREAPSELRSAADSIGAAVVVSTCHPLW